MADTALGVVNQALTRLGAVSLSTFDPETNARDDSANGRRAAANYPTVRDRLLSQYPWSWSLRRALLVRDDTGPTNQFLYAYARPEDMIRTGPRAVYELKTDLHPTLRRWRMVGPRLETDLETVYAEYQARVAEALWPPAFETYVIQKLMADWSYAITHDSGLRAQLQADLVDAKMDALKEDEESSPVEDIIGFGIHDARWEANG